MFRIAHVSDLHLSTAAEDRVLLERLFDSFDEFGVDHIVLTGDVTDDGNPRVLTRFDRILRKRGWTPERCTVLAGNHDLPAIGSFRRRFGLERATATRLAQGEIGLVTVNSVKRGGIVDARLSHPRGWLTRDELEAVGEALEQCSGCATILMALHHHLFHTPASDRGWVLTLGTMLPGPWKMWGPLQNADELLEVASQYGVKVVLSGHSHTPRSRTIRGIRCFISGSTADFEEYRVFDFEPGEAPLVGWARLRA